MREKMLNFIRGICGTKHLLQDVHELKRIEAAHHYEIRRNQLIEHMMYGKERGVTSEKYTDHEIIVSLTTYGKRIYDVAFTIESIMQQSMKANRIVLWLDHSFDNKRLPQALVEQQKRGLEIAFCTDIRSYTKLVPALRRFPNDAIITIDDDALYDYDLLERLIVPYLEDSSYIYCYRYHRMKFDSEGQLLPYMQWDWACKNMEASHLNFLTGVGGVLYPPHSLSDEVTNEDVFLDICKHADDVWFNAMAIMNGTKVKKVYTRNETCEEYLLNQEVQDVGLLNINTVGEQLNDKQIHAVFSKYDLYKIVKGCLQ